MSLSPRADVKYQGMVPDVNVLALLELHLLMKYVNKLANNQRGMTFGMTVPRGQRYTTRIIDEPKIGIGGSQRPQVETSVKELICASSCGAFIQDAVGAG